MSGIFSIYQPALQGLGYAIFHSLWQAALLFFPVQVLMFFVHKSSARYKILFGAFSLLFIAFISTFFIEWQYAAETRHSVIQGNNLPVLVTEPAQMHGAAYSRPWWQCLMNLHYSYTFRKILLFISISYALGVLLLGMRMVLMIINVRKMRKGVIATPDSLQELFLKLKSKLSLTAQVRLFLSERVKVPVMLGYFKPVIILPVALLNQLDWQQTEAILLHEMAHVKRKDYLFNIMQSIIEVFMFFNPLVWWFAGAVRREREHACDDIVVAYTQHPVKYAEALLQLEYARNVHVGPALAATGNSKKYTLLTRIKRIVEMKTATPKSTQSIFASATIVMIIAAVVCFYAATAQDKDKKQKSPAVKTQTKSYNRTQTDITVNEDGKLHTYSSAQESNELPDAGMLVKNVMISTDSALAGVDWDQLSASVSQALQDVNWDAIGKSIKEAGEQIDWEEINRSLSEARNAAQDIDWKEIHKEINTATQSIKSIDKDELIRALENVKHVLEEADNKSGFDKGKIDNEELKNALEGCKRALQDMEGKTDRSGFNYRRQQTMMHKDALEAAKEMYRQSLAEMKVRREDMINTAREMREDARESALKQREAGRQVVMKMREEANKRRVESVNMRKEVLKIEEADKIKLQGLLEQLEKEGLIDRSRKFNISYKDDQLDVNGKKVPAAPYKTYFKGGGNAKTIISGDKNKLSVTQTN